jgi:hypothetical protein
MKKKVFIFISFSFIMSDLIKIQENIVFIKKIFLYTGSCISISHKVVLCKATFNAIGRHYPYSLLLCDVIELRIDEDRCKWMSIDEFIHILKTMIQKVERDACMIQTRVRNHLAKKHVDVLRLEPGNLFDSKYGSKRRDICCITTFHKFK